MEKRTRTIQVDYWVTSDGEEFTSEDAARHHELILEGKIKKCEMCKGEGYFTVIFNKDIIDTWGYMGEKTPPPSPISERKSCPECSGKGYLEYKGIKEVWE